MLEKKVRVRFAPSPTGYLHIGSLRTALYNYLFAKKNGGSFALRIEDTDQKREVENATEKLLDTLAKFFPWDEGPMFSGEKSKKEIVEIGEFGSYIQSRRISIYKKYAEELIKNGRAYYCFCSPERLEKMRNEQIAQKKAPMYDRTCCQLSEEEVNRKLTEGLPYVIRLKVPRGRALEFHDLIRGKVTFSTDNIDDQVLLKSDGFPTYHLANVVDDHLMRFSHIIRGEDWLPSTPKHILLYEAFGWEVPVFAHLPLLLNQDKSKLSKRQGDVAVEDYLNKGYLKEAIINFVALLGWNPGDGNTKEVFSLEELIDKFDFNHVHKAGAIFDTQKLNWLNSYYIKQLPLESLYQKTLPFLESKIFFQQSEAKKKEKQFLEKFLSVAKERLEKLSSIGDEQEFFFKEPTDLHYPKELLRWKDMNDEKVKLNLKKSWETLRDIPENDWKKESIETNLLKMAQNDRGEFLWPIRVALTGEKKSPSPFECAWVLGKEETLERITQALKK